MYDLKITGGTIIDGTGKPGFLGDIGIRDGKIVAVGDVSGDALETVDAKGRAVAPGFVDSHTHYDAQAFWEPTFSPSCYHGVTTIVGGFCGFSIAPMSKEATPYIQRMLSRVEGMPLATLENAVRWDWSSFGDYLGKLDGKIGLNAGFFAGHSAIRRIVMGERAVGQKCTPEELDEMKKLLDRSLAEGALGFSTTVSPSHNDYEGNPVPSRWAEHAEIVELAKIVAKHDGAGLEVLPDLDFGPGMAELLADVSVAGERAVNWNVLMVSGRGDPAAIAAKQLRASDLARAKGGEVLALTAPVTPEIYMTFYTGVMFDVLPGIWRQLFKLPIPERIAKFKDPEIRKQLAADAATVPENAAMRAMSELHNYVVVSVHTEHNKKYEGRKIGEIAAQENRAPVDVMFGIAIDDGLKTVFAPDSGGYDQKSFELRGKLWADDRTLVGASDAGAHLDLIDSFAFSTALLQKGVREHKVIGLEAAIHQITQRPAIYFGLIGRGAIAEGNWADLVIFDPATIGRGPTYQRYDIPGGEDFRLYAEAEGIAQVFVNGVRIVENGKHTGKLPGKVLRSGKDTRTMPMNALQKEAA